MIDYTKPARVRFAPSPTGHLHLGGARTALYDYLLAKKTGGQFILRIEDTDRKRFVEGAEDEIINSLRWLGLSWDEGPDVGGLYGPYRQSERKTIYQQYAEKLINQGQAYYCFCSSDRLDQVRQEQQKRKENPHYDGTCRNLSIEEAKNRANNGEKYVIRFKMPKEGSICVADVIRGTITVENNQLDDSIIVKSDGLALYHLAASVDDHLMEVTHVIRGSEWLPTFPLHGHIHRAFGWKEPEYVHLSVFLKPSGKGKMSKREAADLSKDGYSIFVKDLVGLGYTPEAVVNWISLMGWSFDDHTEYFEMNDLIEKFSLEKLNPSPAAINFTKLDYFNGVHIRRLPVEDLAKRIEPFFKEKGYETKHDTLKLIAPIIQERLITLDDAIDFSGFFFEQEVSPKTEDIIQKGMGIEETINVGQKIIEIMKTNENEDINKLEEKIRVIVEETDYSAGQVFGIMRIAITGQKISPPLFDSINIIGIQKSINRMEKTIDRLKTTL